MEESAASLEVFKYDSYKIFGKHSLKMKKCRSFRMFIFSMSNV